MAISYLTFIKHAEKMVKDIGFAKPALKGVYHAHDGSVVVSDGNRIYAAKNVQSRNDGASIDPETGELLDGVYPNVNPLIPTGFIDQLQVQSTTYLHLVTDAFIKAGVVPKQGEKKGKKEDVVLTLSSCVSGKHTELSVKSKSLNADIDLGPTQYNNDFEYEINAEQFLQALKLFKDAGYEELCIKFYQDEFAIKLVSTDDKQTLTAVIPVVLD
ncbi:hypothetical protein RJD11_12265 [Bacillus velezensis]|uniref:hypothetical protein n=1 Tax=Bacillus TaxID=1386 RepID=UPI001C527FFA|nr:MULTISPECIES: hypothetical protein [Bacillus amyloliquefaciens group]QXP95487.1 hypothetical protein KVY05_11855 [Bacillus velezensis]QXP99293.1 hypothetical protein KVY05_21245 [Bacillus velezensis]UHH01367.1 hypothetical protein LUA14_12190 [Bacillus amyloliquefaciens]ULR21114.1 hypothetical protein MJE83_12185 [Bacillus velezensis]UVW07857.1 hypothetical protein NX856_12225 [Bacillus velezensis]